MDARLVWDMAHAPNDPAFDGVALTLGLPLSSVVSTMASGIIAVGLFGATWVAGVVGGIGGSLGNEGVAQVGTVSRIRLQRAEAEEPFGFSLPER